MRRVCIALSAALLLLSSCGKDAESDRYADVGSVVFDTPPPASEAKTIPVPEAASANVTITAPAVDAEAALRALIPAVEGGAYDAWINDGDAAQSPLDVLTSPLRAVQSVDDALAIAHRIATEYVPRLTELIPSDAYYKQPRYYAAVGYAEDVPLDDFIELHPDAPADPDDSRLPKYLFVRRSGEDGDYAYAADVGSTASLPAELLPRALDEVTRVVVYHTTYTYALTYNNDYTKGYDGDTAFEVYDYPSGRYVGSLPHLETPAPFVFTYFNEPPEHYYPGVGGHNIAEFLFYEGNFHDFGNLDDVELDDVERE